MRLSIIVIAFNEEKLIAGSLAAICAAMPGFTDRGWQTELIVCDNNSTDRTAELARAGGATVVFEPVNSMAGARNKAASTAAGDWFLFMDADTYPSQELFTDVAEAMESGRYLYGGCTFVPDTSTSTTRRTARIWNRISRLGKFAGGPFIWAEAAAFRKVGGFDTKLFASEDIDFSKRMKRVARAAGKKGVILNKHPMVTSARKAHLYTFREHASFLVRAIFTPKRTLTDRDKCHIWYDGKR